VLDLPTIERLLGGKLGVIDAACPFCGPTRRAVINQRRKVFRIWHRDPSFATFCCQRCGEKGYVRDDSAVRRVDPAVMEHAKAEAAKLEQQSAAERLRKARALWSRRKPVRGSPVETYLRDVRAIDGEIPGTIGFLPPRGEHSAAMICAFGQPVEAEPGVLVIPDSAVRGVQITRLQPNGRKADGAKVKIMVGSSAGSPIVIAPVNDLLGLAITEGVEDALSVRDACGLGAWAAGAASRLPALASAVPDYVEAVSILVDADDAGQRNSNELARRLRNIGVEVRLIQMNPKPSVAA
jgi:hypothetical protein